MEFPENFEDKSYGKGSLLVANPVLPDPNFSRTVVLLCNHDDQGSFGLVINRAAQLEASEVFSHIRFLDTYRGKIYVGGPVSPSMVFFLCRSSQEVPELDTICEGVHLGTCLDVLETVYPRIENPEGNIRFYLGYSGWSGGQLAGEMEQRSWLVQNAKDRFVFSKMEDQIWPEVVHSLGEKYHYLTKAPVNPQWN